jgi:hypothetical protein
VEIMAPDSSSGSAVVVGGSDGAQPATASIAQPGPAATSTIGGVAAGLWPEWARPQLAEAIAIADAAPHDLGLARLLYRQWFSPPADESDNATELRPLAGVFRAAHAGSRRRVRVGGVQMVNRFDLIGPDGWWRTWGEAWTPPRSRRGSVRLMLTPRRAHLAELVTTVTGTLLGTDIAWSLGCATSKRRIGRYGGAVLDLASLDAVPDGLLESLSPLLHPVAPPLCLPIAPGVGAAEYPDNGMTFGEHRCHLVALALRHPSGARDPLRAIAAVFAAHGIDPARPHGTR